VDVKVIVGTMRRDTMKLQAAEGRCGTGELAEVDTTGLENVHDNSATSGGGTGSSRSLTLLQTRPILASNQSLPHRRINLYSEWLYSRQ
jgi:hypothetical protein